MRNRHRLSAVLVGAGCTIAIAACGSSGGSSGTGTSSSGDSPALKFADCMRSNGVSNFPDPSPGGGLKLGIGPGSGINPQSPAFQSAQKVCAKLLPAPTGGPPQMTASQYRAALMFARCMRSHGLPDFPDPTRSAPDRGTPILALRGMFFQISSGLNPMSPAFRQAAAACGLGPPGAR